MKFMNAEDHILIQLIRTAGHPTDTGDGVQLAKQFLDSLSPDQIKQLEVLKQDLGPDAFRDLVFQGVGEIGTQDQAEREKILDGRRRKEDDARQRFNMPSNIPVALPEDEHIQLVGEGGGYISNKPSKIPVVDKAKPIKKPVNIIMDKNRKRNTNAPTQRYKLEDFAIAKNVTQKKGSWWNQFKKDK